jgi:selenocysteine lyase/cysteine desulfurase
MSAYKFYGPHIGILYGKKALLQETDFPRLVPAPDYAPENAETGTQNQEGMVGAGAAVDFLASLGYGTTRREQLQTAYHELHLRSASQVERLWEELKGIKGVRLYGPPPTRPRTATVAFTIENCASSVAAGELAKKGLFLSHGDFYAATVVERLGLGTEGLLRAGCACYSTMEEIDRLVAAVSELTRQ